MASCGSRALRSTSSAAGPATSRPSRSTSARSAGGDAFPESMTAPVTVLSPGLQLCKGIPDRRDTLEDAAAEHAVREFDIEPRFKGKHHVDASERAKPRIVQISVIVEHSSVH